MSLAVRPIDHAHPLEKAVVDMLLEKQGEPFDSIRQQLSDATRRSSTA